MQVYSPSPAFAPLAEVTTYTRLQIIRRFIGRSVIQIDFPVTADIVSYMQKNCWIVADDDEPFIIRNITQTEKTVTIYGFGGHFGFEGRITIPPTGLYAIEKTGSADAVVKEFIQRSTAAANRSLNIVCEEAHDGAVISDQSRLKNLGDEVSRMLVGAGRGERFRIRSGYISFDTYAGTDRSASCVFDLKYKNVKDFNYTLDATKTQSTPIVGGAGEGVNREMYITGEDAAGWDRREVFIDARDVNPGDTDTLTQRAQQALLGDDQQVKADVSASANLIFGVDYFLGDIVKVNVPVKTYVQAGDYFNPAVVTIPLVVRITDATETVDNGVRTVDLTFGSTIRQSDTVQTRSAISQLQSTESDAQMAAADMLTQLKTVDGAGSGLDADTLQGKTPAELIPAAADILTQLKTVDGAGSGLDADTVDGKHASAFATSAQGTKADSSLQPASSNRPGVTKLYRNDSNSAYNVQTYWNGSRWVLQGYNGDTYHAPCLVDYANSTGYAGSAGSAPANGGNADKLDGQHGSFYLATGNGNARRGTCTLNTSSWVQVNFSSAMWGVPTVVLTPNTSTSGAIAGKVRNITASGFEACIGGSGYSGVVFNYIAIY